MLAEDGSGKGAGLVSAIAQRINSRNACNEYLNKEKALNGAVKEIKAHTNGYHNGIVNGRG